MEFSWKYEKESSQLLRGFIRDCGISKQLLAKIKFQGGKIEVDGIERTVRYLIHQGEVLKITIPDELEHETMLADDTPIEIVFEDEHLLLVNKPAGVASIPAQYHPNGTMANRVKGYYKRQGYKNQVIHIVTRLDRDTTGLMLFAKHGFAHAQLDVLLRAKKVEKMYKALVSGDIETLKQTKDIIAPIGRDYSSLIKRTVSQEGKFAHTEYLVEKATEKLALVDIRLHTGRTHQIRVHFEYMNTPLLGDDLYGGKMDLGMNRQALHCAKLSFEHPFTKEKLNFSQPIPPDMKAIVIKYF
ncbi:MAG: RluA family pseudouridine synthase [Streptococcaceae bacterium]|jgi:23S rRNA pseudouridine1911/1915/1917 synthase|nr:RluA family pseudouridine synthase [Streptococcaceae bacterium]